MSREHLELVRNIQPDNVDLVELFGGEEGQASPFGADPGPGVFADDFEVRFISRLPEGPQLENRGLEGLVKGSQEWLVPWSSYWLRVEDFIDADDEVVVLVHLKGRTARDGVEVQHSAAAVWTFEGGQIVKLRFYLDRDEAIRVAGLKPQHARNT